MLSVCVWIFVQLCSDLALALKCRLLWKLPQGATLLQEFRVHSVLSGFGWPCTKWISTLKKVSPIRRLCFTFCQCWNNTAKYTVYWHIPHPLSVYISPFSSVISSPQCQAEQSKEEQRQEQKAEKLMRKASKDVCRLREQSQKVPLQVQSFRWDVLHMPIRGKV